MLEVALFPFLFHFYFRIKQSFSAIPNDSNTKLCVHQMPTYSNGESLTISNFLVSVLLSLLPLQKMKLHFYLATSNENLLEKLLFILDSLFKCVMARRSKMISQKKIRFCSSGEVLQECLKIMF